MAAMQGNARFLSFDSIPGGPIDIVARAAAAGGPAQFGTKPPPGGNLPTNDRVATILGCQISSTLVALIFLVTRIVSRGKLLRKFGTDDALIVISWLFSLSSCLAIVWGCSKTGLGRHTWTLNLLIDINRWNAIQIHVTWMHIYALVFVRLSIMTFYLRISPKKTFHYTCYTLMAINVVWAIVALIVNMTVCTPPQKFWKPEIEGSCRNPIPFNVVSSFINISLDVATYLTPMPMIRALNINQRQKVGLYITFGVGLLAVAAGIIRLPYLYKLIHSDDFMYEQWGVVIWSSIELNLGIVGACIPALKALLRKVFPGSSARSYGSPYPSKLTPSQRMAARQNKKWSARVTADRGRANASKASKVSRSKSLKASVTNKSQQEEEEWINQPDWDLGTGREPPKGTIMSMTEITTRSDPADGVDGDPDGIAVDKGSSSGLSRTDSSKKKGDSWFDFDAGSRGGSQGKK